MRRQLVRPLAVGALLVCGVLHSSSEAVPAAQRPDRAVGGWNAPLRKALAGTTRVRLKAEPECSLEEPAPPKDVDDPAEVAALLKLLVFEELEHAGICACIGGTSIEFHRGDGGVETLQLVCGVSIRWRGWPGDGEMPLANQEALVEWLARHGVTGPREERLEQLARLEAWRRQRARATSGMSPALREAFEHDADLAGQLPVEPDLDRFRSQLAAEAPRVADRIALLLRILGADFGSWSGLGGDEVLADRLLRGFPRTELAAGCAAALLGNDRQARRGAARMWDAWQSPIEGGLQEPALRSAILSVLQESRSPDLRQRGQSLVREWWSTLPEPERESRLDAGLHDPIEGVRRKAMLVAGQVSAVSTEDLLMRVLAGEPIESRALPSVPPEEEEVGSDTGANPIAPSTSEPEVAALALAYLRSTRAQVALDTSGAATPGFRVARALLGGRCDLLVAEDFRYEDPADQARQLAAVEAVVRCQGRQGLKHALDYQQASHWWEPEHVASELRRMLMAADAPGRATLDVAVTLGLLGGWYERYGPDYERRARVR